MPQTTEADIRAACQEAGVSYEYYCTDADPSTVAAIDALARRIAAERAGIVAWLRQPIAGGDYCEPVNDIHARIADAIEAQQDKEPQT